MLEFEPREKSSGADEPQRLGPWTAGDCTKAERAAGDPDKRIICGTEACGTDACGVQIPGAGDERRAGRDIEDVDTAPLNTLPGDEGHATGDAGDALGDEARADGEEARNDEDAGGAPLTKYCGYLGGM